MFKNITMKLFVIITALITIFVGSMLFLQSTFFHDYYRYKKTQAIESHAKEFIKACFSDEKVSSSKISAMVQKYAQNYGCTVYYNGNDFKIGSYGVNGFDINFFPEQIKNGHMLYLENKASMDGGKEITYLKKDDYGNTNIITVNSIIKSGKYLGLLYIFSSLQPVSEASMIIKDYYAIFFCAAFIIIIIASFLFSKQVARPLIHINKIASAIASLDFTQECTIKSQDELGDLSNTINLISLNLNSTINELKKANKRLGEEVAKQKELQDMRELFIAGVSHELKTPISVIQGYTEGIIDGIERDMVKREYAEIIKDETEKMNKIVLDMLDLSQMKSGKYKLKIEDFSLIRIIKYEIKKFAPQIKNKNIDLKVNVKDDNIIVAGDSMRIEQVISNLLSNAVRYTSIGGEIILRIYKNDNLVFFEIENSCEEVSDRELNHIWDDFYRIDKSGNRELGGTGLGLTVVKSILELHNSEYGVTKTKKGIKFYFSINGAFDE